MPLKTSHHVYFRSSQDMEQVCDGSVDLVVTSPPYPMISMWDNIFFAMNPEIRTALEDHRGMDAFRLMHDELDRTWNEVSRVMKDGGIVCVNIGDATRTVGGEFRLYSSHSRVIQFFTGNGFNELPGILWRKQTNSPNKFMGSGMLPVGAYVTLEHEHILVFRKGRRREFAEDSDRERRMESAFFWEERNTWFSDLWQDLKGIRQDIGPMGRARSGAYPLSVPFRLVNMYSVLGDTVLDPFTGTGTTIVASAISGRNSLGYENNKDMVRIIEESMKQAESLSKSMVEHRMRSHGEFLRTQTGGRTVKNYNNNLSAGVKHRSEEHIRLFVIDSIRHGTTPGGYEAEAEHIEFKPP